MRALVQNCRKVWLVDSYDNNWFACSPDLPSHFEDFIILYIRINIIMKRNGLL